MPSSLSFPPQPRHLRRLGALFASAALLAIALPGCGGGGGGGGGATPAPAPAPTPSPPPPPPATVAITGKAVDGPLAGATACYDLNDNLACDAGEPVSSATAADGAFTISVLATDAGGHAIVVNVPATAIDGSTNAPVGAPITLSAPATNVGGSQNVFVSPLTTMVLGQMLATGSSAADAAAYIQQQAGLALSPLVDFTGATPEAQQAALLARLIVQTQIAMANALAPQLGQTDVTGATVTQADIDKAIANALRGALPALAQTAASPAVTGAGNVQAALVAAAQDLVATQPALDPVTALAVVSTGKLPGGTTPVGIAAATLRALSYTDANNWTLRFMASNAQDNTPDAQGLTRFYDVHKATAAGVISTWGFAASEARKGDLHWNGSAWVDCPLGLRSTQTLRDAQGRNQYDYCDGYEKGTGTRTVLDVAGQSIASVITTRIRVFPGVDSGVPYANWGPADLTLLGNATFPAGAQIFYQTSIPTFNAYAYDVAAPVGTFGTGAAGGGDTRAVAGLACHSAFIGVITQSGVATLEQLATVNPGMPCIESPQTDAGGSSLDPNVWWGATSLSLGNVTGGTTQPAGTGNFFTTTANLRVAFTGGNSSAVTYLSCYVRTNGGSTRNCLPIGSGSFTITQLGDGRVMTFNNLPAITQRQTFNRVFVERGGVVYFGYRNVDNVPRATLRLNLPAANAVLTTLGIAEIVP